MRVVTWKAVRTLGELRVLTRASYFTLVIVPMLAALWPGLRVVVNRYNDIVTDSTRVLQRTAENLRQDTNRLRDELAGLSKTLPVSVREAVPPLSLSNTLAAIDKASLDLEARTRDFVSDYPARTLESPRLPPTWAAAFFAALAVLIGHLVYQVAAPDVVQRYSPRQFVSMRLDEYTKYRSRDALEKARYVLSSTDLLSEVPAFEDTGDDGKRLQHEIWTIELGAKVEYQLAAAKTLLPIVASASSYLVAIALILWIVVRQSRAVAHAAGWLS